VVHPVLQPVTNAASGPAKPDARGSRRLMRLSEARSKAKKC
jgi:hypothetical protein